MLLATRPLLRQIENLQSGHNAQTINWESVEESLSEKLGILVMLIIIYVLHTVEPLLKGHSE